MVMTDDYVIESDRHVDTGRDNCDGECCAARCAHPIKRRKHTCFAAPAVRKIQRRSGVLLFSLKSLSSETVEWRD